MNKNLLSFCDKLQTRLNEHKARVGLVYFREYLVTVREGKRYDKVMSVEVAHDGTRRHSSLVAFVDRATGGIFKPASFAAPAKHERGNINSADNGMEAITEQGNVHYLR